MNRGSILVIGRDGLLGRTLAAAAAERGLEVLTTTRRASSAPGALFLDLAGPDVAALALPAPVPAWVCLCAGCGSVEACAKDPEETLTVNVTGPLAILDRLAKKGCFPVVLSSSRVFDGNTPFPTEGTATRPVTEYGRQKTLLETAVLARGGAVLRLTKVVTDRWRLPASWVAAWRAGKTVEAFADQGLAPVSPLAVAALIISIGTGRRAGVWHASSADEISYADLAASLLRKLEIPATRLRAVAAAGRVPPCVLQRHMALDTDRTRREFGTEPVPAFAVLETLIGGLQQTGPGEDL